MAVALIGAGLAVAIAFELGEHAGFQGPWPLTGLVFAFLSLGMPAIGAPLLILLAVVPLFGWFRPLWRRRSVFTWTTWAGTGALALLSAAWFAWNWQLGLRWQGPTYTRGCAAIGATMVAGAAGLGGWGARRRSEPISIAARWLVMVWAVTYGFPYFGELP